MELKRCCSNLAIWMLKGNASLAQLQRAVFEEGGSAVCAERLLQECDAEDCFRESEQINVGNVWIVGSDGSEEEEQEAFVERIESKNEYFETAEFHLVSVEEYLLG
ncbi:hypothetical protein HHK36_014658 [Tetracentron sinense]|uniref:Uncharacterized protein n=1 Tax=Tetracentron sinense TaxID=13715 RepID=A0A834YZD9_TETSI|nr:hypothetical protein HHK36_014658 [Tetracentron sinense]